MATVERNTEQVHSCLDHLVPVEGDWTSAPDMVCRVCGEDYSD